MDRDVARDVPWPLYALVTAMDYDTPNMQVAQWNLSLQKTDRNGLACIGQLSRKPDDPSVVHAAHQSCRVFLGLGPCTLNGVHTQPCSTTGNTRSAPPAEPGESADGQYYGYVTEIDTGGTASYNGLLLSVQRRAARGITVSGNYTWSHCISDPRRKTATFGAGNAGYTESGQPAFRPRQLHHRGDGPAACFQFVGVAETPQFSNATLRAVASGWRFSPIFKILSGGYHVDHHQSRTRALNGIASQRVNQLLAESVRRQVRQATISIPQHSRCRRLARSEIRERAAFVGPGTWQFDAGPFQNIPVREAQKLEFRAEAFNVTNLPHERSDHEFSTATLSVR